MQSLKFFLSLSLLVSWTVRCKNFDEKTKKKASPFKSSMHCFFKNLSNKEEKRSEFFRTLLICVNYTFFDKDEVSFSGLQGERLSYKTYIAEFSIKNEKNVKSFDETGYYENFIRSKIDGKNLSYLDKLNLKILEHPSIIEIKEGDYKETKIDQMNYTFKKVELQLIKGLDRLKWIKLKDIEFKKGFSSEKLKISESPRMEWYNKKIKRIEFETDFITILFNILWRRKNIEERNLKNFGLSAENIEIVNEESSVINILSKYFGEEVQGIHKVEKEISSGNESDGKETKKNDSSTTSMDESSMIVSSSKIENNDQIKDGEDKKKNDSEKVPEILSSANESDEKKKVEIKDETSSSSIITEIVEDNKNDSLAKIQDSYFSEGENEDELETEDNTDNENDGIVLEEDRKEENRESGDDEVKDSLDESKTEEEKKKDIEEESSEDQETEKDIKKKDGKGDPENKKQSTDKKEGWGIGKSVILSVVVIGLILLLLILGFLLYPRAKK